MNRRFSEGVLWCGVPLIAIAGGLRTLGVPLLHYGFSAVVSAIIIVAAWSLGARAVRVGPDDRRRAAIAGGLLLAFWAALPFVSAMGPPHAASAAENTVRYVVLLLAAMAIAGGLFVLREALRAAGEQLFSTLGHAAIALAYPMYMVFAAVQLCEARAVARGQTAREAPWMIPLDEASLVMLFFGALLTYLSGAAFAAAIGRCGWIGPRTARAYIALCLVAPVLAVARIVEALASPGRPIWSPEGVYALPGFVAMIPAVPWIPLCLMGIAVVRHAGDPPDDGLMGRPRSGATR